MLVLAVSHAATLAIGFGAGVYVLPILIAPAPPPAAEVKAASDGAVYRAEFRRDLKGSDFLHWGEGKVFVSRTAVSLEGRLAPGPDYKLYLAPQFVDTKEGFLGVKSKSFRAGDIKTFENFLVRLPEGADIDRYDTVVVWCETFSMFISAAKYR
ncbi:MAG: DM13 domain-containing protein [Betaproteobacteria bacterium]